MTLLPEHRKVLRCLEGRTAPDGELCICFRPICRDTKLPRARVRFICRALARKGLAEYFNSLCRDDGQFVGAGYCITQAGLAVVESDAP